jgi:hypothetical protein
MAAKSKALGKQKKSRRAIRRRGVGRLWGGYTWVLTLLGGTIMILAAVAFITRDSDASAEEIVAEYTEYDFGTVPIDGGLISTEFPLQAVAPAKVTRIQTT